ncbi:MULTISPECIES: aspartyl-phosphate phosphatase Spo0E family protein [Cohnella]|uniref:aspartyl-phosphate phosphatase Spo0E family protein n=1 Tax=Cohnella TaxID=329857 RepID=UPI0009B98A65|nr:MULTISPECIES: aspartyl-phosphate phosphatase Spo0E family protein [Cohnella]MBN2981306.1 Spo0E family sporulation regulatory protein-aspartic acid phosphatase [Cohnella algarum]
MDNQLIIHRLQSLQNRLRELADNLGNLTDPEILRVSEEADRLIVQLQRMYLEQAGRHRHGKEALFPDPQPPEKVRQEGGALSLKHS